MIFSCFCSNKRLIRESILSPPKIIQMDKTIKLIDTSNNSILFQKEFNDTIVSTTSCFFMKKKHIVVCTKNTICIMDEYLNEIHSFQIEDEILCMSGEKIKPHFYIGCKSGNIYVYSIKYLNNKFICTDIWTFHCFKPVYSIAIHIDENVNMKRNIFAGFSRWQNDVLQQINIYNII